MPYDPDKNAPVLIRLRYRELLRKLKQVTGINMDRQLEMLIEAEAKAKGIQL